MVVNIDIMMLKPAAHQKSLILSPDNKESIIIRITALITIRNSPNVNTVIGNVKKTRIGFKNILAIDNNIAVKIA
jgi:hypothetical protein